MNAHDLNAQRGEPIDADDFIDHKIRVTLRERVLDASAREKDNLPWSKLAKFGTKRTDKTAMRHVTNVEWIAGIECDYDIEQVAFVEALAALNDSFALSQAFYYGWECDSPKPDHRAQMIGGSFIDHLDFEQSEGLGAASASEPTEKKRDRGYVAELAGCGAAARRGRERPEFGNSPSVGVWPAFEEKGGQE